MTLTGWEKWASPALEVGLFAGLFAAFLILEQRSFVGVTAPVHSGDSGAWGNVAAYSVLSREFYTGERPFTVPLLYKLANSDEWAIGRFQSVFSVACWFSLALAIAMSFRPLPVRLVVAGLICLFSLTVPVNQWDYVVRSESLSYSLIALAGALTIVLARRYASSPDSHVALMLWWALVCLLAASTRDSLTYLFATLWAGLALWFLGDLYRRAIHRKNPRFHRGLLASLLALGAVVWFTRWATMNSIRWHTPLVNVIVRRVLPDPTVYNIWVTRYGFPRNEVFEQYAGQSAQAVIQGDIKLKHALRNGDPAFADVQAWLATRGVASYQRFLLWDNLGPSLASASRAFVRYFNEFNEEYGKGAGMTPWTIRLTQWLYPEMGYPIPIGIAILIGACLVAVRIPSARLPALFVVFMLVNSWAQAFINYHGDAAGVERHMSISGMLYRLAFIVAVPVFLFQGIPALYPHLKGKLLRQHGAA